MSGWSPNNSKYDCWQIKTVKIIKIQLRIVELEL